MSSLTSSLILRLVDGVTGPARGVRAAIRGVEAETKRAASGAMATGSIFAGGAGLLAAGAGIYAGTSVLRTSFKEFADYERRITRILVNADASAKSAEKTKALIRQVAREVALSNDDVTSGLEALVAAGRALPDALAFLPTVARTAQATGSATADIAKTADAIGTSLKINAREMQEAFDTLAMAGKAGKFELKDMAQELPSLAAAAGAVGFKGVEGLRKLAAMLQSIRQQTGSSSEAATAMANVLQKMETQETVNKFKKFGVDVPKAMAQARREGKNLVEVFLDLVNVATKGDLSKLPQLIADAQFAQGVRALAGLRKETAALESTLKTAGGTIKSDLMIVTRDAAASAQRFSTAMGDVAKATGNVMDALGGTDALNAFTKALNDNADVLDRYAKARAEGKSVIDSIKEAGGREKQTEKEAIDEVYKFHMGSTKTELDREAAARRAASLKRTIKALEDTTSPDEQAALAEAEGRLGSGHEAVIRWKAKMAEEIALLKQLRQELGQAIMDSMAPLTGVQRFAPGPVYNPPPGPVSGATRPRPRDNLTPPMIKAPPVEDAMFGLKLDDASAAREAAVARARVQQVLDANPPVIRPRVEMPSMYGMDGSFSDNGGRR